MPREPALLLEELQQQTGAEGLEDWYQNSFTEPIPKIANWYQNSHESRSQNSFVKPCD
ncbi:hypothetical protein SAMN05216276_100220 [Streptosporangium subroseum]|uniref:Uncharacterized protein n=1 Tax=Streptosporangium subroseum TaxID=106412 RepID=A0A239ALM8_9ACTN|nr:hypothetical protein SAMN05216276_100220 [Streptosporangium subroseum]